MTKDKSNGPVGYELAGTEAVDPVGYERQGTRKTGGSRAGEAPTVYVDKTGTDDKPNPMTDVFLEFPMAMRAIAAVTKVGAKKHAPRGWQMFEPEYGKRYHESKMGRHLLDFETIGFDNPVDGLNHPTQAAWNMLAWLENVLKIEREKLKQAVHRESMKAQEVDDRPFHERIKEEYNKIDKVLGSLSNTDLTLGPVDKPTTVKRAPSRPADNLIGEDWLD